MADLTPEWTDIDTAKNNFRINDLMFDVPPTNISIDHLDMLQTWQPMRSRTSTKVPTGRGDLSITAKWVVVEDELWKLHRLVQQFKYTPFWQIENAYIRSEVLPGLPTQYSIAVCAASLSCTSFPDQTGSLWEVSLVLLWFNYFPFTKNLQYKKDWYTQIDGELKTIYDIPVEQTGELPLEGTEEPEVRADKGISPVQSLEKYSKFGFTPESLATDAADLGDLAPKLWQDPVTDPVDAHHSNIYTTYLNYLQAQRLNSDFGTWDAVESAVAGVSGPIPYPNLSFQLEKDIVFDFFEYKVQSLPPDVQKALDIGTEAYSKDHIPDRTKYLSEGGLTPEELGVPGVPISPIRGVDPYNPNRSPYGMRLHPVDKVDKLHAGIDLGPACGAPANAPIRAVLDGQVHYAQKTTSGAGNAVCLKHANDIQTKYFHLDSWTVRDEQEVKKGDVIGYMGNTGVGTGPHLHFGVYKSWQSINPDSFFARTPVSSPPPPQQGGPPPLGEPLSTGSISPVPLPINEEEELYGPPVAELIDRGSEEMGITGQDTLNELTTFLDSMGDFHYYKSPHVSNVFLRPIGFSVSGGQNSAPDAPLVCTSQGFHITNNFARIPLLGWEWPTYQYMGGQDTRLYFSFVANNPLTPDRVSEDAEMLSFLKNVLETNSRQFRYIPGSWTVKTKSATTQIAGVEHLVVNRIRSESIPGQPGLYAIDLECEVGGPLDHGEQLELGVAGGRQEMFREIIKELSKHVIAYHVAGEDIDKISAAFAYLLPGIDVHTGGVVKRLKSSVVPVSKVTYDTVEEIDQGFFYLTLRKHMKEHDGPAAKHVNGWDNVVINTVNSDDDPDLHSAVEQLVMSIRALSIATSQERYGGLTLEELQGKDMYGLERFVFPVFDSKDYNKGKITNVQAAANYIDGYGFDRFGLDANKQAKAAAQMHKAATRPKKRATRYGRIYAGLTGLLAFPVNVYQESISDDPGHKGARKTSGLTRNEYTDGTLENQIIDQILTDSVLQKLNAMYNDRTFHGIPQLAGIIEEYNSEYQRNRPVCYPDLPLPPHPHFGTPHFTEPDFYFYNEMEGQDILEPGEDAEWRLTSDMLLQNALDSWERLSKGEVEGPKPQIDGEEFHDYVITNEGSDNIPATDGSLKYRSADITRRFGEIQKHIPSGAGFFAQRNLTGGLSQFNEANIDHGFDLESLKAIGREASYDLARNKMMMRRAFPTYKIEFIQFPDQQVIWQTYSRAHSYSSVLGITLTRNKNVPADLAIVELQNVSGVLTGGLAGAITDVDYWQDDGDANTLKEKMIDEYRQHLYEGTPLHEFFNSIIVRAGIAIRVKLGYSNDPRNLEARFVGRIVEARPSQNSDAITLICQSYGVELVQGVKGISGKKPKAIEKKYNINDTTLSWAVPHKTTYEVLSACLQAPEVMHFGRTTYGAEFYPDESLDSRRDVKTYERGWQLRPLLAHIRGNTALPLIASQLGDSVVEEAASSGNLHNPTLVGSRVPQLEGANIFGTGPYGTSVYAAGVAGSFTAGAGVLAPPIYKLIRHMMTKRLIEDTNDPSDDNFYCPHPDDYVKYKFLTDPTGTIKKDEIEYRFLRTTIWDAVQEMTLRHPGWIVAPVPYGDRMTLFFGVPSQKYWCKPADPRLVKEINSAYDRMADKVKESKSRTLTQDEVEDVVADLEVLVEGYNLRFRPFRRYHLLTSRHDILHNSISTSTRNTFNTVAVSYNKSVYTKAEGARKGAIGNFWEWGPVGAAYSGAKGYIAGDQDITSFMNRKKDVHIVKLTESMHDKDVVMQSVSFPNCNGEALAHRYGVSMLMKGLAAMYSGELVILSTSNIKPHDVCFILDDFNNMAGPIVVKEITTTISANTGMIDTIIPEAFVTTNEMSSKAILDASRSSIMEHAGRLMTYGLISRIPGVNIPLKLASSPVALVGEYNHRDSELVQKWGVGHNIVGAIAGGLEYYLINRKQTACVVVPLQQNGEPLIAGIPDDLLDGIFDGVMGWIESAFDSNLSGYMERVRAAQLYGYHMFKPGTPFMERWHNARARKEIEG
jgi:hypothetical protein